MNILFTTFNQSYYRVEFFEELGKHCNLTVIFQTSKIGSRYRGKAFLREAYYNFNAFYVDHFLTKNNLFLGFSQFFSRKYDVFVLGGYSDYSSIVGILLLKSQGRPFFISADGMFIRNDNKLKKSIKRSLVSSATYWLSSGKHTTDALVHYGAVRERVFEYPFTSVRESDILEEPVSRSGKLKLREELGIKEEKVIISVGQFIPRKGYDVLLKVVDQIPKNVGIYLVGGKPPKEYLEILENTKTAERVHFIEFKPKEELQKYYMASDLFVLPTREDIWGLVINEAMAYGLPVITTDRCIAGLELVENGKNGFIVPVEDTQNLSEKVLEILSNDELQLQMGWKSLEKIRPYTIENMAVQHLRIFEKVLRGGV